MAGVTKEQVEKIVTDAVDKLALAVRAGFDDVDEQLSEIKSDGKQLKSGFNVLQTSVDSYAMKADSYFKEMAALQHAIKRHEKWIEQLAKTSGVTLEY